MELMAPFPFLPDSCSCSNDLPGKTGGKGAGGRVGLISSWLTRPLGLLSLVSDRHVWEGIRRATTPGLPAGPTAPGYASGRLSRMYRKQRHVPSLAAMGTA